MSHDGNQGDEFELRRRLVQMEMLYEVGLALSESLDPAYVADELLQRALMMVDARSGLLLVRNGAGDLHVIGHAGEKVEGGSEHIFQLPEVERAWAENMTIQVDRGSSNCRYLCILPLECRGEVGGLLIVTDKESREGGIGPFDANDETVLHAFSLQAGAALHNAGLHRNLEETNRQLVEAQDKVAQLEQLRALGDMAAEVAHGMRHVLGVIIGRADLYRNFKKDPDAAMDAILESAAGGQELVERIQRFSRLGVGASRTREDVNSLIESAVEDVKSLKIEALEEALAAVDWVTGLDQLPQTYVNTTDLKEVFSNLLINGAQAMPSGGRMEVTSSCDGEVIRIAFTDTGAGMSKEVVERVFEPFFTTKEGLGSGLGLSIVLRIVEDHGGHIEIESEAGSGSTFTVSIPVVTEAPAKPEDESRAPTDSDR